MAAPLPLLWEALPAADREQAEDDGCNMGGEEEDDGFDTPVKRLDPPRCAPHACSFIVYNVMS